MVHPMVLYELSRQQEERYTMTDTNSTEETPVSSGAIRAVQVDKHTIGILYHDKPIININFKEADDLRRQICALTAKRETDHNIFMKMIKNVDEILRNSGYDTAEILETKIKLAIENAKVRW
jgi:hypothetical protein